MTLEFLPEAEEEAAEATAHYEEAETGLGVRFRMEVESAATAILQHPLLWHERRGGYRRVNLPAFPYYLAYVLRGERARIIAVGHATRRPGYWRGRLRQPPAA